MSRDRSFSWYNHIFRKKVLALNGVNPLFVSGIVFLAKYLYIVTPGLKFSLSLCLNPLSYRPSPTERQLIPVAFVSEKWFEISC